MNLIFAIKILSDFFYFLFVAASITSAFPDSTILVANPVIVAVAAYCARAATDKLSKRAYARFLPLLGTTVCFFLSKSGVDHFLTALLILYLSFVILKKRYAVDYTTVLKRFYLSLKLLPAPLVIVAIASNWRGFSRIMLPYFLLFLILSVMLLRMLRHSDKVLTDRRFRLMNVSELLLLCFAGFLLSRGYMLTVVRYMMGYLVRFVLRPLLMGVVYVLGGFAWVLNKIFSGIDFSLGDVDMRGLDQLGDSLMQGEQGVMENNQPPDDLTIRITTYVLIGIGFVLLVLVAFFLFRAFMKAGHREEDNQFEDEREPLDDADDPRVKRLTRAPRDRVRHYYRKFLKLCDVRGIGAGENLDSSQINDRAESVFRTPALPALRDQYIKARYSSAEITRSDVKSVRDAYEEVRKSVD